jgi:glyoxylase-like metal-dependent hydrolase (beta-lactamase superfamily II)
VYPDHQKERVTADIVGAVTLSIHSWVVRTPQRLIVIDTATGNGRDRGGNPLFHNLQTGYARRLAAAGVDRYAVDTVLLTHLHTDHDHEQRLKSGVTADYQFGSKTAEISAVL